MQIYGDTIRVGIHSGQQYATFDQYLELWQRAEKLGYDWVSDFDHFRPMDRPNGPCFEGMTLLAALAARTRSVRCGMLVLAVSYRHPAIVASMAATIDHISGGRLELGLGAGSYDIGQEQYGLPLPRAAVRLAMLNEACKVIRGLWTKESIDLEGKYYQLKRANLVPQPLQKHVPIVLGGSGEQRTLRIVAEHADIWNTIAGDLGLYQHKIDVLASHCADVGRDPNDIRKSVLFRAVLASTEQEAEERLKALLDNASPDLPKRQGWLVIGTPEQCAERLRPYIDLGVSDFLLGVREPIDWQTIELFVQQVAPMLRV